MVNAATVAGQPFFRASPSEMRINSLMVSRLSYLASENERLQREISSLREQFGPSQAPRTPSRYHGMDQSSEGLHYFFPPPPRFYGGTGAPNATTSNHHFAFGLPPPLQMMNNMRPHVVRSPYGYDPPSPYDIYQPHSDVSDDEVYSDESDTETDQWYNSNTVNEETSAETNQAQINWMENARLHGERLYQLVAAQCPAPSLAQRVTGMLLELRTEEVLGLFANPQRLQNKVVEALAVLRTLSPQQSDDHDRQNSNTLAEETPTETNWRENARLHGERLYQLVAAQCPEPSLAQRVTGMLLELRTEEVLGLFATPQRLQNKVQEALALL